MDGSPKSRVLPAHGALQYRHQRVAKDLLRQVVSRYLARRRQRYRYCTASDTAVEMSYAMAEGDWKHLGELLDRHWQLNQVLDPHTTNAPIHAISERARPLSTAQAGRAGGGGFLMLLTRTKESAAALARRAFTGGRRGGAVPDCRGGLR